MDGGAVFNFTASEVVEFIKAQNLDLDQYNLIFHQANSFMLNYMRNKLGVQKEKFIIDMKNSGNTVSSSIPIVISQNKKLSQHNLFLCGFGIGLSYSSVILERT